MAIREKAVCAYTESPICMSDNRVSLLELKSGKVRPTNREKPHVSSAAAGWNGFLIEEQRIISREANDVCWTQHQVVLYLDQPFHLEWRSEGNSLHRTMRPGLVSVLPASIPFSARVRTAGGLLHLSIDPKFFARVAAELGYEDGLQPRFTHGVDDPLLRELMLALREEARNGTRDGTSYAESLATSLSAHLLRNYCSGPPQLRESRGGLTRPQLSRIIDHIHAHLAENLSLQGLARLVRLSSFHFARMFRKSTGLSPHQYLIRCRVLRAKERLLRPDAVIAEVATEVGFCDQSHLSAHFKRHLGISPRAFARAAASRHAPTE